MKNHDIKGIKDKVSYQWSNMQDHEDAIRENLYTYMYEFNAVHPYV